MFQGFLSGSDGVHRDGHIYFVSSVAQGQTTASD